MNYYNFFGTHFDLSKIVAIAKPYVFKHGETRPVVIVPVLFENTHNLFEMKIPFLDEELEINKQYSSFWPLLKNNESFLDWGIMPLDLMKIHDRVKDEIDSFISAWASRLSMLPKSKTFEQ